MLIVLTLGLQVDYLSQEEKTSVDMLTFFHSLGASSCYAVSRVRERRWTFLIRFVDAGSLAAREVYKRQHRLMGNQVVVILQNVDAQSVKSMWSRTVVIQLSLGVASVLLAESQQVETLLKAVDWHFN